MRLVRHPARSRPAPASATSSAPRGATAPGEAGTVSRHGWVGRVLRTRVLPVGAVVALAAALPGGGVAGEGLAGLSLAAAEGSGHRWTALTEAAADPVDDLNKQMLKMVRSGAGVVAGGRSDDAVTLAADPGRKLKVTGAAGNVSVSDIPEVAMRAYTRAERVLAMSDPECRLSWSVLAAIGRVESNHGRYEGVTLAEDGFGSRPIRGLSLDGTGGVGKVVDTDRGRLDGDVRFDRAMGPMQFIPATWESVGVDADGDGERNADNIFDAAVGAGVYLCSGGGDLTDPAALREALHRYNPSDAYVDQVTRLARAYLSGAGMGGLEFGSPDGGYAWDGPGSALSPYDDDYFDFDADYYGADLGFDVEVEAPPIFLTPSTPANPAPPPALALRPADRQQPPSGPAPHRARLADRRGSRRPRRPGPRHRPRRTTPPTTVPTDTAHDRPHHTARRPSHHTAHDRPHHAADDRHPPSPPHRRRRHPPSPPHRRRPSPPHRPHRPHHTADDHTPLSARVPDRPGDRRTGAPASR